MKFHIIRQRWKWGVFTTAFVLGLTVLAANMLLDTSPTEAAISVPGISNVEGTEVTPDGPQITASVAPPPPCTPRRHFHVKKKICVFGVCVGVGTWHTHC